ncbi:MAG: response regulator [Bacteroidia bacterium]|nr:response regulator [Bacteroidia bacterium]
MADLRIGIIEDDFLIADSIKEALEKLGYTVVFSAPGYARAIDCLTSLEIDFVLIDINLGETKDGVDVARWMQENKAIPFIFLTANSDKATVDRAKLTKPLGYLVKPFDEHSLYSSIEVAFEQYNQPREENKLKPKFKDFIFVKKDDAYHKVEVKDIVYVQSENVYLTLFTASQSYLVRTKMDDFLDEISPNQFVKIHRSYAVNSAYIQLLKVDSIVIRHPIKELPVQKPFKQKILEMVQLFK